MILWGIRLVYRTHLIQTQKPTLCALCLEPDIANYLHIYTANPSNHYAIPPLSFLPDWLQLTGLIHDVGKLLALWGEPQWAAVGDTFPVGCAFAKECVFPEQFQENPDFSHPVYRSALFPSATVCSTSLSRNCICQLAMLITVNHH